VPIIVTADKIHFAARRTEIKSAGITPEAALNMGQRLSVKMTKFGTGSGMSPLSQKILQ
jgi:hypothetical protein